MIDLEKLVAQMTLSEKIGQLTQYNANVCTDTDAEITGPRASFGLHKEDICKIGSVLNFRDVEEMRAVQDAHLREDRNKIPLVFMLDVIHGYRTIFPIPLALGGSFDEALVAECTRMAAVEAAADGVHVTFTPMVDFVRDARWGRVMETCGEDPMLNSRMGAAMVKAFQREDVRAPDNLATCVKHFAAYGGAEAGRDYNTVDIAERTLREYYFPAYKACIDAGAKLLMPSFNSLNGVPSVANEWLMRKVLREEWGYDGTVVSDYAAVAELVKHGAAADLKEAAKRAFACGCDMEMCSSAYYKHLAALVEEGTVSMEEIDAAVLRVLRFKEWLGLFDDPYHGASRARAEAVTLTAENRALARRAAAESAVLLKNEGVLPFDTSVRRIALIGPFADEHAILGGWRCRGRLGESVTVREGIENALPHAEVTVVRGCGNTWDDTDTSGFAEAIEAAKNADVVLLCLGEPMDYSSEGNCRTDLRLPGMQEALAAAVAAENLRTAAVLFNGRPLVLRELSKTVPAILEMWFPGTEGGNAVADLVFGKVNPSGKLTMSFPKATGQCPIYYNHTNTGRPKPASKENERLHFVSSYVDCGNLPLYTFGYGLSYSNFVYEELTLDATEMTADGAIRATVTVYNDSDVPGVETVQLYLRDVAASVVRPVQQLLDYAKVTLLPHERRTVTFTVTEPQLRFWNFACEHVSEPGEFRLSTGYAEHLLHTKAFILK